jgi:hypothetical protein
MWVKVEGPKISSLGVCSIMHWFMYFYFSSLFFSPTKHKLKVLPFERKMIELFRGYVALWSPLKEPTIEVLLGNRINLLLK